MDDLTRRLNKLKKDNYTGTVTLSFYKGCISKKIKLEIFKNLDTVCNHDTILATNTSSILIQDIAAVTNRKEKVIGMPCILSTWPPGQVAEGPRQGADGTAVSYTHLTLPTKA